MRCPRCRNEVKHRRGVCHTCGADLTLTFTVSLAAGAVVLTAGIFFLALSAVQHGMSFLPIGLAELGFGLFVVVRANLGLKSLGAVKVGRFSGSDDSPA